MIVTDEVTDDETIVGCNRLWMLMSGMCLVKHVILGVDFVVVEEVFIEARRVVSLDAAMGFKVVTATFLETEEIGVGDGFAAGSKVVTH